jgi:hypothetical protein
MLSTTSRANRRPRRRAGGAVARASIARAVMLICGAIAAILVIAILLVVLEANRSNELVQFFRDAASLFAGPLDSLFTLDDNKAERAVNWGLAAIVWVAIGRLVARLLLRR